jgi:hypothetical protein
MKTVAVKRTGARRPIKVAAKAAPARGASRVAKRGSAKRVSAERAAVTEGLKPYKNVLRAGEVMAEIADRLGEDWAPKSPAKAVKEIFAQLEQLAMESLMPRGAGEFTIGRIIKVRTRDIPAKKMPARKATDINPFSPTKEPYGVDRPAFTKPATVKVKALAMGRLKKAALGQ